MKDVKDPKTSEDVPSVYNGRIPPLPPSKPLLSPLPPAAQPTQWRRRRRRRRRFVAGGIVAGGSAWFVLGWSDRAV